MMNAGPIAERGGADGIVLPAGYRSNCLLASRALSQTGRSEPLIWMLDCASVLGVAVVGRSVDESQVKLHACNAFLDPDVAGIEGRRLMMPERAVAWTRRRKPARGVGTGYARGIWTATPRTLAKITARDA